MVSNCQTVSEMIPEYINKNTTPIQNAEIACHISKCLTCRADLALWLSVGRSLEQAEKSAPSTNFEALFDKIPDGESELEKIIKYGSYGMAFDIVRYAFRTVKSTYRLARLLT